jgi:hypothetical protein
MTKNNRGRRLPLSGSGEALFRLSFFPDEIDAGPCLSLSSTFFLKHVLMPWTVVAIAMGVGLTGRGLPLPCLHILRVSCNPRPRGRGQSWRYATFRQERSSSTARCAARWKAVPRIAINRKHPDGILTKYYQLFRRALPAIGDILDIVDRGRRLFLFGSGTSDPDPPAGAGRLNP